MKARCIKADPLGWLAVGEEYEYTVVNNVFLIGGFGVNKDNFEQMFERL